MGEGLACELELFAEALRLQTVGVARTGELEMLRSLVGRYPEQARAYLVEVEGTRCTQSPAQFAPAPDCAGLGGRVPAGEDGMRPQTLGLLEAGSPSPISPWRADWCGGY